MANNLKGLTVEISGDTRPLTTALKELGEPAKAAQNELKALNAALKLDPSNVTLLTQKQKLLEQQIGATEKQLHLLERAEQDAVAALPDGETDSEGIRAIQREAGFARGKLEQLKKQAQATADKLRGGGDDGAKAMGKVADSSDHAKKGVKEVGDEAAKTSDKVSSFGDVLKGSLAADLITASCKAIIGGLKDLGSQVTETLDSLGDLDDNAQKVNMSAESLQEWTYAAKLGGMESETLVKALEKQQKSFADAKTGSDSLRDSYAQLGLDVDQFETSEQMLNALIDALADCGDETTRNAIANDIFGKSYAELAPLLNFGADGIEALRKEAHELGLVIDNETVTAAAEAGDVIDRLSGSADAAKTRFLSGLLPSLTRVSDKLREELNAPRTQKQLEKLGNTSGKLAEKAADLAIKVLPKLVDALEFVTKNTKTLIPAVASAVVGLNGFKIVSGVGSMFRTAAAGVKTFGAACVASPVGALVTALGLLVSAILVAESATESEADKLEDLAEAYRDAADAAEDTAKERAQAGSVVREEIKHYDDLIAELGELVDANGRVKDGMADRAAFVASELSEASGLEIEIVDGVVQKYNELTSSIKDSIMMRQAESYLTDNKADYDAAKAAIANNEVDADGNYAAGSLAALEAARETAAYWDALVSRREELLSMLDTLSMAEIEAAGIDQEFLDIDRILRANEGALDAAHDALTAAEYAYDQNAAIVEQYSDVQSGVWAQDAEATAEAMDRALNAQMTAETASVNSLKRQQESAVALYKQYQEWGKQQDSSVTAEQISQYGEAAISASKEVWRKMLAESEKYSEEELEAARLQVVDLIREVRGLGKTHAKKIGEDIADGGVAGIKGKKALMAKTARENGEALGDGLAEGVDKKQGELEESGKRGGEAVVKGATDAIADGEGDIESAAGQIGAQFNKGLTDSIYAGQNAVVQAVRTTGSGALSALRNVWEIRSPSRASGRAADMFNAGVVNHIDDGREDAVSAVRRYARAILDSFEDDLTLTDILFPGVSSGGGRGAQGAAGTAVDLAGILSRLDGITRRLDELDTTMVLDDGTLIARTDRTLGKNAEIQRRGGM